MKFSELLRSDLARNPGKQQEEAAKLFAAFVESSRFELWTVKNSVSEERTRLVIGVATYAPEELILLDRINQRLSGKSGSIAVEVFNFLDCADQSDIDIRVPRIGRVYQTPIVGLWEDGKFRRSEQGLKARELLKKFFD